MIRFLVLFCLLWTSTPSKASAVEPGLQAFGQLPVLHKGRIKPIDTVARHYLLALRGKSKLTLADGRKVSALEWLVTLMTDQAQVDEWRTLRIYDTDVIRALALTSQKDHLYSFKNVYEAVLRHADEIEALIKKNKEEIPLTRVERHLFEVYERVSAHMALANAVTCLAPSYTLRDPVLAGEFKVKPDQTISFYRLLQEREVLQKRLQEMGVPGAERESPASRELLEHAEVMWSMKRFASESLSVIPDAAESEIWRSPWWFFRAGHWQEGEDTYLSHWEQVVAALVAKDDDQLLKSVNALTDVYVASGLISQSRLKLEDTYNRRDPFMYSIVFYILAMVILVGNGFSKSPWIRRIALGSLIVGLLLHVTGISMRSIVMQRPPVGTLYEAIVFSGAIGVLMGVIIEFFLKNRIGIMTGGALGGDAPNYWNKLCR